MGEESGVRPLQPGPEIVFYPEDQLPLPTGSETLGQVETNYIPTKAETHSGREEVGPPPLGGGKGRVEKLLLPNTSPCPENPEAKDRREEVDGCFRTEEPELVSRPGAEGKPRYRLSPPEEVVALDRGGPQEDASAKVSLNFDSSGEPASPEIQGP